MDESPTPQPVRLRRVLRPVILGAASLVLIAGTQIPGTSPAVRIAVPLAGLVLACLVYLDVRTSYTAGAGRLTVRRPGASGSVDLSRLSAAEAVWVTTRRRAGRWVLVLTDDQGNSARLDLAGTTMRSRRKLLDVLVPYIKVPAVRWEGQVDRALAGALWNPGFRSARQWEGVAADD